MLTSLKLNNLASPQDVGFLKQHYILSDSADWVLNFDDGIYHLKHITEKLMLSLDFTSGKYQHRNQHPAKEPLAKAVKVKQKLPKTLFDATPGVLKDSLMLANRGVKMVACERNPLLYIMVKQALAHLTAQPDIDYHFGDARQYFHKLHTDIIYLDPMYPAKKKQAQVKMDMQVLHHIIGADSDADQLFESARKTKSRIVVKRPSYANPLGGIKPNFTSQTGATRFDIYLPADD